MNNAPRRKPGSGVLFPNQRKRGDRDPDFTGRIMTHQGEHWLAAWWNERGEATGTPEYYLRVSVGRPVEEREQEHPAETHPIGSTKPMSAAYRPTRSVAPTPAGPPAGPEGYQPPSRAQPRPEDGEDAPF